MGAQVVTTLVVDATCTLCGGEIAAGQEAVQDQGRVLHLHHRD